ncbi:MAG: RNA polymerase factor sigma-54 [Candidatus Kapaibacterium sp.]
MKLSLDLKTTLTQTLTPQQIQYLKLLQLPLIQLEQHVRQELEQNPMLEEFGEIEIEVPDDSPKEAYTSETVDSSEYDETSAEYVKSQIDDKSEPFEFYNMLWQDDSSYMPPSKALQGDDEENSEYFQVKDVQSFTEELIEQLRMYPLTEEEFLLGTYIIGNIDPDGYLRRDLSDIVDETNSSIAELNFEVQKEIYTRRQEVTRKDGDNPARQFALSERSREMLSQLLDNHPELTNGNSLKTKLTGAADNKNAPIILKHISIEQSEHLLAIIRSLDPPGIGSRDIRECLTAQLKAINKPNAAQKLALEIMEHTYDAFTKKHYHVIIKQLEVNDEYLREAIDEIKRLNPKPGDGNTDSDFNTVIPDFIVEKDIENDEIIISVNDSRLPSIKLSTAYEKMKKETNYRKFNKDTKTWIRNKYEDAKFLIQAIRQRKSTMLKVMTAISALQRDFFDMGPQGLRPLIYKDVSEQTGLDISTVCRIVNGKYVQTEFGTYELKFFFSEALPTDNGEEVSTTVVKQIIKGLIAEESKSKPLSDERLSKLLKEKGYNVARRTVAKYREQLKIPVARLRKEL